MQACDSRAQSPVVGQGGGAQLGEDSEELSHSGGEQEPLYSSLPVHCQWSVSIREICGRRVCYCSCFLLSVVFVVVGCFCCCGLLLLLSVCFLLLFLSMDILLLIYIYI